MTLLRNPWFYLALACALLAWCGSLLLTKASQPEASRAEKKALERRSTELAHKGATDSIPVGRLLDQATDHYTNANRLLYDPLPVSRSAARLHESDSAIATW